ncbi:MAG: hypothetical protein EOO86_14290 [Pedobacter sp.]|nr:MAG: hypothetical protein EOO86_14290 [Pedobacter sp.]
MAAILFIPFIFFLLYQKAKTARANYKMQEYKKFKADMLVMAIVFIIGSGLLIYMQLLLNK